MPTLVRYSFRWFLIVASLLVLFWAAIVLREQASTPGFSSIYRPFDAGLRVLTWLVPISIGANILLDFVAMIASVGSINRERQNASWDLLRLTELRRFHVILVKHTIAQIQSWRISFIIVSARLAVVLIIFLQAVSLPVSDSGETVVLEIFSLLRDDPLNLLAGLLLVELIAVVYVVEPLWRLRAMTALGLAISARVQRLVPAIMAGLAGIIFVWIAEVLLIGGLIWLIVQLADSLRLSSDIEVWIFLFWFTGTLVAALYLFYSGLQRYGLRRATRNAFAD